MVRKHSILMEKTVVKVLIAEIKGSFPLSEWGYWNSQSLCNWARGWAVPAAALSIHNEDGTPEKKKSCLYSKKKSRGHSLLPFVSEYFCILCLGVFQRDLFCSAAQPDEGCLGNLSQNFIMTVYLLCSNQGFPVQEQCSNYQARGRAVASPL